MKPAISVAMAACNGANYIEAQMTSILAQLPEGAELVISDDGSTDGTQEKIRGTAARYQSVNVRLIDGPQWGIKQNFANAIRCCEGDIIFLSDQDDVWMPDKLAKVLPVFDDPKVTAVVHDARVVDAGAQQTLYPSYFAHRGSGAGVRKNIWKNTYVGCCMAFRAELRSHILPIPDDIEMHDQWIGILSDHYGKSVFLPETLLLYRRHGENASTMHRHSIRDMIVKRAALIRRYRQRVQLRHSENNNGN